MSTKLPPSSSYLHQCIQKLVSLGEANDSPDMPGIDLDLLQDISFYIKKRFDSRIDESEICALLAEALQKLQKRLNLPGEAIDSPPRYFREIVKHLISDKITRDGQDDKYLISAEGVAALAENGVPKPILLKWEGLISPHPISYRTFMDRLAAVYADGKHSRKEQTLYRRIAMSAFRFKLRSDGFSRLIENVPDPASQDSPTIEDDVYTDCLQRLKRKDRDLIKLRFGLDRGLGGVPFSFEELQEIFGFSSLRQVRNRYHYILKILRDCLTAKGYPLG